MQSSERHTQIVTDFFKWRVRDSSRTEKKGRNAILPLINLAPRTTHSELFFLLTPLNFPPGREESRTLHFLNLEPSTTHSE